MKIYNAIAIFGKETSKTSRTKKFNALLENNLKIFLNQSLRIGSRLLKKRLLHWSVLKGRLSFLKRSKTSFSTTSFTMATSTNKQKEGILSSADRFTSIPKAKTSTLPLTATSQVTRPLPNSPKTCRKVSLFLRNSKNTQRRRCQNFMGSITSWLITSRKMSRCGRKLNGGMTKNHNSGLKPTPTVSWSNKPHELQNNWQGTWTGATKTFMICSTTATNSTFLMGSLESTWQTKSIRLERTNCWNWKTCRPVGKLFWTKTCFPRFIITGMNGKWGLFFPSISRSQPSPSNLDAVFCQHLTRLSRSSLRCTTLRKGKSC